MFASFLIAPTGSLFFKINIFQVLVKYNKIYIIDTSVTYMYRDNKINLEVSFNFLLIEISSCSFSSSTFLHSMLSEGLFQCTPYFSVFRFSHQLLTGHSNKVTNGALSSLIDKSLDRGLHTHHWIASQMFTSFLRCFVSQYANGQFVI